MLITRQVAVKVIVTDEFKQQLVAQIRQALQKVDLTRQQLEAQGRQYLSELEDREPAQGEVFRRKLDHQKQKQDAIRRKLSEELSSAETLEIGDEYPQGTVEGLAEINEGDVFADKVRAAEIVVKDGLVVEIRHC